MALITHDMPRWHSTDSAKFEISHVFALNRKSELTLRDASISIIFLRSFSYFDLRINNAESKRKDISGRTIVFSHDRYRRRGSGPQESDRD
jgi:hypothetical protein